jgi:catechol 2,3-dioxygenase-like lactoylglutathione lyase family enzyme
MPEKMFTYHSAAAFVKDIGRAKRFYTETLEQEIEFDFGTNVILTCGITLWQIDPLHAISQATATGTTGNERSNRFEFYFETTDINAAFVRLKAAEVQFLHPVHEEPWGQKTIRLYDPDGHLIEVGESMATFVNRLHKEGLTPEAVAARTGIPPETVTTLIAL